jgi:Zn-dependent protease with chaperone function
LALPAPTTGLYFLFIASLLAVGLFVGSWMHNVVLGRDWIKGVSSCLAVDLAQQQACTAPVEVRRGLWSVAGAGVMLVLATGALFVVPLVIQRRRKLKPPLPKHQPVLDRIAQLADEAGLIRVPKVFIGPSAMRDAFSFGRPGSPAVAIPPKVFGLLARPGPADGVVLHEFAHIRHRDIELAWLARSSWYVAVLVLLIPVMGAIWEGPSLMPYYLWRAVLLIVLVEVVTALVLRAREYDADLRAASRVSSLDTLRASLGLLPQSSNSNWIQRLRKRHPTSEERREVLESPQVAADTSFLRALCTGMLAGILGPLMISSATPLLAGTNLFLGGIWTSSVVTGVFLALTVGLDLLRALFSVSLAGHGINRTTARRILIMAVGVAIGLAVGRQISVASVGQDISAPLAPMRLIAPFLTGLGAVFICAGFSAVCLPFARLAKRPLHFWLPVSVLNVAFFVVITWIAESLDLALTGFGWLGAYLWVQYGYEEWPGIAVAGILTFVALLAGLLGRLARRRKPRDWMFFRTHNEAVPVPMEPQTTTPAASLALPLILGGFVGLAASVLLVWQLLLITPIATTAAASQANDLWVSITLFAWLTASTVLCVVDPLKAPATLFISGPFSLSLCALAVAMYWFVTTDAVPLDALLSIWASAMARGLAVSLVVVGVVLTLRSALTIGNSKRARTTT